MDDLTNLHLPNMNAFDPVVESLQADAGSLDSQKKRRPPNAFLLFCVDNRTRVREQNPDRTNIDISKMLAEMWKVMDEDARGPYKNMAKERQQAFKTLVPVYRYDKAKMKRMAKKASDYDAKSHVDVPELLTLVNLPQEELRAYIAILQNHLLISCQQSFQNLLQQDPESFPRALEENFGHDAFQEGQ
jgi:hypothetical protein